MVINYDNVEITRHKMKMRRAVVAPRITDILGSETAV